MTIETEKKGIVIYQTKGDLPGLVFVLPIGAARELALNEGKENVVSVDCDEDSFIISRRNGSCDLEEFTKENLSELEYELIPAIAQDSEGQILMSAFVNPEALAESMHTGRACYYSRSRQKLWRKGEESGHFQELKSIRYCKEYNFILYTVKQRVAACHEGYYSCFFRRLTSQNEKFPIAEIERKFEPDSVYKNNGD